MKITKTSFYNTPFWRDYSKSVEVDRLKRQEGKCDFCSEKGITAHHLKYPRNPFSLIMKDSLWLCKKCNGRIHGFDEPPPKEQLNTSLLNFLI